jgi:hypothetical protein
MYMNGMRFAAHAVVVPRLSFLRSTCAPSPALGLGLMGPIMLAEKH